MDNDALNNNLKEIVGGDTCVNPWMYFELVSLLSSSELDCIILEG